MTFNKSLITVAAIAAAALLSTGSVFAQEATPDTWMNAGLSGKTRAEVSTELAAARKSGLSKSGSAGYIEPVQSRLMHPRSRPAPSRRSSAARSRRSTPRSTASHRWQRKGWRKPRSDAPARAAAAWCRRTLNAPRRALGPAVVRFAGHQDAGYRDAAVS